MAQTFLPVGDNPGAVKEVIFCPPPPRGSPPQAGISVLLTKKRINSNREKHIYAGSVAGAAVDLDCPTVFLCYRFDNRKPQTVAGCAQFSNIINTFSGKKRVAALPEGVVVHARSVVSDGQHNARALTGGYLFYLDIYFA